MPTHERIVAGRYGAQKSWGQTADRSARTRPARAASPSSVDYWLRQLDADRFATATQQQRLDAAEMLRRAYFTRLAMKSAQARKKAS
jgi:hypothetical protein